MEDSYSVVERLSLCAVLITLSTVLAPEWNLFLLSGVLLALICTSSGERTEGCWFVPIAVLMGLLLCTAGSIYRSNSITTAVVIAEAVIAYVVCSSLPVIWRTRLIFVSTLLVLGWEFVHCCYGLLNVYEAFHLGFKDLTPFRRTILSLPNRGYLASSHLIPILYTWLGLKELYSGKNDITAFIYFFQIVFGFLYVVLTFSMTAYVAVFPIAFIGLSLPWKPPTGRSSRLLISARTWLFVLVVFLVSAPMLHRTLGAMIHPSDSASRERSMSTRLSAQKIAWTAFLSHPIVGVGPGNFPLFAYQQIDVKHPFFTESYNSYLRLLAEFGSVGIFYIGAFFTIVLVKQRKLRGAARILYLAGLASVAIFISGEDIISMDRILDGCLVLLMCLPSQQLMQA